MIYIYIYICMYPIAIMGGIVFPAGYSCEDPCVGL